VNKRTAPCVTGTYVGRAAVRKRAQGRPKFPVVEPGPRQPDERKPHLRLSPSDHTARRASRREPPGRARGPCVANLPDHGCGDHLYQRRLAPNRKPLPGHRLLFVSAEALGARETHYCDCRGMGRPHPATVVYPLFSTTAVSRFPHRRLPARSASAAPSGSTKLKQHTDGSFEQPPLRQGRTRGG